MKPGWCFLIFLLFFWEFSSSGQVKKITNEKKKILSFFACPNPFQHEMMPGWCFLIVWILKLGSNKIGSERRKNFLSFSTCLDRFSLKWAKMLSFNFLKLFAIYFGILKLGLGKNCCEQEIFFFSSLYRPVSAWNETRMTFFNFLNFFGNSRARDSQKRF